MNAFARRLALAVLVVAVSALAAGPAFAAKPQPRVSPGSTYLALGDSVTFGYMEPQVVPAPNYAQASSFRGYPEHLARALHLRVFNASCPGETSTSLLNPSGPSNSCESSPTSDIGYRDLHPLHVRYSGSQLSYAVSFLHKHRGTRLVTLNIGANDLFRCQSTSSDACTSAAEQSAVFATIRKNVRQILSSIRHKARYHGQIVVLNYFNLNYNSAFFVTVIRALNANVDAAARPYDVRFADGYGQFRSAAAHSGGDSCAAGLLTQLGQPGKCGVHPSFAGQGQLALALERVLRR